MGTGQYFQMLQKGKEKVNGKKPLDLSNWA